MTGRVCEVHGEWNGATFEERFWRQISRISKGPACWEWVGYRCKEGYGIIKANKRQIGAHRASWLLHFGGIPPSMFVCHRCDNPPCVNPSHLFLGTMADNIADRHAKGRSAGPRGEQHASARLTTEQVLEIRRRCASGELQRVVGAEYGIRQTAVSAIVLRQNWRHV